MSGVKSSVKHLVTQAEAGSPERESGESRYGVYPAFNNRDWELLKFSEKATVVVYYLPALLLIGLLRITLWLDLRLSTLEKK